MNYALKFSKLNWVAGHLDFVAKKFNVKLQWCVDNKRFYSLAKKLPLSKNVSLKQNKITLRLINEKLRFAPVIVYVDDWILRRTVHYPHFTIILGEKNAKCKIFDPWDGKEKLVEAKLLTKGITSLRNHLKFCPQVIVLLVKP